ncbi:hypothetical protein E2C01_094284 [Portunus trituberculatus]|uniref:Uncharacterized protein n=1 Tax=Portunus trituberculatus TaxID=210409 RepID=A0A5B7K188_PORTR|nr:hypothetical protein [Portunus trituberculatus]
MMKVTRRLKGSQEEEESAEWPRVSRFVCGSSHLCFIFLLFQTVTPPEEVVFPATSEQPDSNFVTVPLSVHGCHFAARGCSDVIKESWIQLQER